MTTHDERNQLRRQIADLRDELATVTADRDAKHQEAAEAAVELVTAQLRAEDAERALAEKATEVKYATDVGHAIAAEWEKCTEAAERRAARFRLAWESARRGRRSWRQRTEAAEAENTRLLALMERIPEQHMRFGVLGEDGTGQMLPCADWCYACKLERAEKRARDAEAERDALRGRVLAYADQLHGYCSPHGVSAVYADQLREVVTHRNGDQK